MTLPEILVRPPVTPLAWLETFAACVRARDYDAGRELFDNDVTAFGTVSNEMQGLDALVREQWRHVWGATEGFDFLSDTVHVQTIGACAWAGAQWQSTGRRAVGRPFLRHGRATYVLRRNDAGIWLAVHSHHSFVPAST